MEDKLHVPHAPVRGVVFTPTFVRTCCDLYETFADRPQPPVEGAGRSTTPAYDSDNQLGPDGQPRLRSRTTASLRGSVYSLDTGSVGDSGDGPLGQGGPRPCIVAGSAGVGKLTALRVLACVAGWHYFHADARLARSGADATPRKAGATGATTSAAPAATTTKTSGGDTKVTPRAAGAGAGAAAGAGGASRGASIDASGGAGRRAGTAAASASTVRPIVHYAHQVKVSGRSAPTEATAASQWRPGRMLPPPVRRAVTHSREHVRCTEVVAQALLHAGLAGDTGAMTLLVVTHAQVETPAAVELLALVRCRTRRRPSPFPALPYNAAALRTHLD